MEATALIAAGPTTRLLIRRAFEAAAFVARRLPAAYILPAVPKRAFCVLVGAPLMTVGAFGMKLGLRTITSGVMSGCPLVMVCCCFVVESGSLMMVRGLSATPTRFACLFRGPFVCVPALMRGATSTRRNPPLLV